MSKKKIFTALAFLALMLPVVVMVPGCGNKEELPSRADTEGRPEMVTAYEVVQYTKPAASKWQSNNWMIQVKDGDPDGIGRDGKAASLPLAKARVARRRALAEPALARDAIAGVAPSVDAGKIREIVWHDVHSASRLVQEGRGLTFWCTKQHWTLTSQCVEHLRGH